MDSRTRNKVILTLVVLAAVLGFTWLITRSPQTSQTTQTTTSSQSLNRPAVAFVAEAGLYKNGKLFGVLVGHGKTYSSIHECMEDVKKGIANALESGNVPPEGSFVGACVPFPAVDPHYQGPRDSGQEEKPAEPTPNQKVL